MVAKTSVKKQIKKAKQVTVAKTSLNIKRLPKLRIGIHCGKDFDPVPIGTQDRNYPESHKMRIKNGKPNSESHWGGMFHMDVSTALKMQRLHPDLISVDLIKGKDICPKRLKKNHVNMNFWYDVAYSLMRADHMKDGKAHIKNVRAASEDPECRLYPAWDYYDWIMNKPRYMKQCIKAGVPMIDSVFFDNGLTPAKCLKAVKAKGWDKFFVKVGHFCLFGQGAINGKTADFLPGGPRAAELEQYAKENKDNKVFIIQPYTLKPNGEVFDEVRNYFVDGKWTWACFTHGTDNSDAGYYSEPDGPRGRACRNLAIRAFQEVLKACKWEGKPLVPLLSRIDIGVVPTKGGDSLKSTFRVFVNEVEPEISTWLPRYCKFNLVDTIAPAGVKKVRELLTGLLNAGRHVPDEANVRKVLAIFDERLGPLDVKLRC